jgi:plasmid stability protein
MGVLTVRALDDALIKELRIRAARHGRSAEAEHRLILEEALRPRGKLFKSIVRRRRLSLEGRDFSDSAGIIRRFRDEAPDPDVADPARHAAKRPKSQSLPGAAANSERV